MNDALCDNCRNVFATKWRKFSFLGSHDTKRRPGWRRNVSRLCHFRPCLVYKGKTSELRPNECRMCYALERCFHDTLRRGLEGDQGVSKSPGQANVVYQQHSLLDRLWDSFIKIRLWENDENFRLRFELLEDEAQVNQVDLRARHLNHLWFKLYADADSSMSIHVPRRPNLWETSSESTFAFIRRCILQCDSTHECKNSQTSINKRAPSRLIRIDGQQDSIRVSLIDTSSLSDFPQYCALSYCWGDPAQHHQVKTLKANIDQHKSSINVSQLPQTILDALICCRKLELPYLWVDALCIVQDDDVDKLSEIAAMGDIYTNAYLTIAASIATGSSDGFLESRENPYFSAPMPTSNGSMGEVKWAIRGNGLLNSSNMVTLNNAKVKMAKQFEPLHTRGWTFQEAMLSKKILFYSFFQPYWICQGMACSGGDPSPEEYFTAIGLREMFKSLSRTSDDERAARKIDGDMGYQWPWVAEQYSSRVLSMLGDKILAIHSIKDKYRYENSAYASGVWLETLKVDLLWSTTRRHPRTNEETKRFGSQYSRGRVTDIPSWSWLSFDGSIRFDLVWHAFHLGKIRHINDIVSHIQTLQTPETDEFGRLTGRPLRLRGRLKKVVVIPPKGRFWENRIQTRSCYQLKVWDAESKSYTMKMNDRAALESRIGEAVFDEYVDEPRKDGKPDWTSRRESFEFAENYEVAPMLLDCLLVSTVGDRTGDPMFDGKPKGYSRQTQGNETAYGVLVHEIPGCNGDRKQRIGLFRGDEGLSFYFDDAVEREFDFE